MSELEQIKEAVRDYISEFDNPVPDAVHRRFLRNRLRCMVGAPVEPPPREMLKFQRLAVPKP